MPLAPGASLGSYEIVAPIGAGGMGEVYRARDRKLNRDVAIKVLPAGFAGDADRVARFRREAQTLAALNHPNVAAIYGIEESGHASTLALVMELVDGDDLAVHIARGPLPLVEALPIARQIAAALEAAHELGIVHRDLKPANIKVRADGTVKVLDFGLAKALGPDGATTASEAMNSPTLTARATQMGVVLGTAAYMAPEQAKGRSVDKRADIWAFGAVLFEMLTGARAFKGDDVSDTLASVLKDAPSLDALPASTPPALRRLIERCLERDVKIRLRDIGEARIMLDGGLIASPAGDPRGAQSTQAAQPGARWRWLALGGTAGALIVALASWAWIATRPATAVQAVRFSVSLPAPPPAYSSGGHLAISPDGRRIVLALVDSGGRRLYSRAIDQVEMVPIRGTEVATSPFFSPDGQWVAFFADGKLKKVPIEGGAPVPISDVAGVSGAWGVNDQIVLQPTLRSGLLRVSANGGRPEPLTTLTGDELGHTLPQWLPDGKTVIFSVIAGSSDKIVAVKIGTTEHRTIVQNALLGRYVDSGYLTYFDETSNILMAVPFSSTALQTTGPPVRIAEGIGRSVPATLVDYDASRSGTVVYIPGGDTSRTSFAWVNRDGTTHPLPIKPQAFEQPRLSADGKRMVARQSGDETDVWGFDLIRGTSWRLTFDPTESETPLWMPDGARILFAGTRPGKPRTVFWKAADGGSADTPIATVDALIHLTSLSPNGREIALTQFPSGPGDIMILTLGDKASETPVLRPFLKTSFNEFGAVFSPDGHWIAYTSNEGSVDQVFVQAYPGPGGKWQVSIDGGSEPVWAKNGRELFFRNGDKMMSVPVTVAPTFIPGAPVLLFEARFEHAHRGDADYDVSADGRFLMIKADQQATARAANVMINLPELRIRK